MRASAAAPRAFQSETLREALRALAARWLTFGSENWLAVPLTARFVACAARLYSVRRALIATAQRASQARVRAKKRNTIRRQTDTPCAATRSRVKVPERLCAFAAAHAGVAPLRWAVRTRTPQCASSARTRAESFCWDSDWRCAAHRSALEALVGAHCASSGAILDCPSESDHSHCSHTLLRPKATFSFFFSDGLFAHLTIREKKTKHE